MRSTCKQATEPAQWFTTGMTSAASICGRGIDHGQKLTWSGGISYALNDSTKVGANYLFGSGLRKDGAVPNGASLPAYFQLNHNLSHDFAFSGFGKLHTQLAVLNALDRTYELRDGTGIGVGAPQFGPRRGLYLSVQKDF